jgi:hypothetical protein
MDHMSRKKGKFVFVESPKWETNDLDYSLQASQIYLRVAFAPDDVRLFCVSEDLLPPPKLSPQQLRAWCDGARAMKEKLLKA